MQRVQAGEGGATLTRKELAVDGGCAGHGPQGREDVAQRRFVNPQAALVQLGDEHRTEALDDQPVQVAGGPGEQPVGVRGRVGRRKRADASTGEGEGAVDG
jgi:hypothetical protein